MNVIHRLQMIEQKQQQPPQPSPPPPNFNVPDRLNSEQAGQQRVNAVRRLVDENRRLNGGSEPNH